MKLLEDIISESIDEKASLAGILRKCLVLADILEAGDLKNWANQELDGYDSVDNLPDYRTFNTISKGNFTGPLGASVRNQPLPSAVMEKEHRHFCEKARLNQPIAAYHIDAEGSNGSIDWPPNLTLRYQSSFYQGYALANAWQVIPRSAVAGLLDTVRTRILRFALEIKKQIGSADENAEFIAQEKVNQTVTNIIYGGQNVIGSTTQNIQQIGSITVSKDNLSSLDAALSDIGVQNADVDKLHAALTEDKHDHPNQLSIGPAVLKWLGQIGTGGLKIGGDAAKALITSWLAQYLGLPSA